MTTTDVAAGYPITAPRGTGATGGQFVKQPPAQTKTPAKTPAKAQPKQTPKRKPVPAKKAAPKPAAAPTAKPPGPPGSNHLNLKRGGNNDPAEVTNLQRLLSDLKVGKVGADGKFGPETEAAVKAAQAKLGMKPTGRASSSLIRRMADAHALSPCVGKVAASAAEPEEEEPDVERILASSTSGLDLTLWSDSTVWLVDEHGDTVELGAGDATRVVAGLRALPDRAPGSYELADWLTLHVDDDGSTTLVAGEDDDDAIELALADLNEFADQLAAMLETPVAAAAGMDVTPGHDALHHYWTRGEGLAKWADSPTPWTTLVAHLTPHVGLAKAKVYASAWFQEVMGYASGSDKNRVAHGHPPRGHNVGPG